MCGRFVLFSSTDLLREKYKTANVVSSVASYNIVPSKEVVVIFDGKMGKLQWGFKSKRNSSRITNARAETVRGKPTFRESFQKRRCIIPANGFFEWDKKNRRPHYISPSEGIFSFAGLWEEGTCTIITAPARGLITGIHDRMPVFLSEESQNLWLEYEGEIFTQSVDNVQMWPVSADVNKPSNDYPDLLDPCV